MFVDSSPKRRMTTINSVDVLEDWISPMIDDIYDYVQPRIKEGGDTLADMLPHRNGISGFVPVSATASASASASATSISTPTPSHNNHTRNNKVMNVWLTQAFNYIRHSEILVNRTDMTTVRSDLYPLHKVDNSIHMDLLYSGFVPPLIRTYISERGKYIMRTKFNLSGHNFVIDNMFFGEVSALELEQYKEMLHWVIVLIGVMVMVDMRSRKDQSGAGAGDDAKAESSRTKSANKRCHPHAHSHTPSNTHTHDRNFHIQLFLTPFIKTLPTATLEAIGPAHVNSGVSSSRGDTSLVMVFRNEEWFKVLIHELFHVFHFDLSLLSDGRYWKIVQERFQSTFPIKSDFNISESIAEFWATMLNAAFIAYRQTKPSEEEADHPFVHLEYTLAVARFLIMSEQVFSLFQMAKILNYMNMTYEDLYRIGDDAVSLREYFYREETNVFAYYILKTIMLYNGDDYIAWSRSKSYKRSFMLSLNPTDETILSFYAWVITKYKSAEMLADFKKIRRNYLTLSTLSDDRVRRLAKTMRMTIAKWDADR